jgi:hypothetical protein
MVSFSTSIRDQAREDARGPLRCRALIAFYHRCRIVAVGDFIQLPPGDAREMRLLGRVEFAPDLPIVSPSPPPENQT